MNPAIEVCNCNVVWWWKKNGIVKSDTGKPHLHTARGIKVIRTSQKQK